jgi:hypothetical protein
MDSTLPTGTVALLMTDVVDRAVFRDSTTGIRGFGFARVEMRLAGHAVRCGQRMVVAPRLHRRIGVCSLLWRERRFESGIARLIDRHLVDDRSAQMLGEPG